MGKPNRLTVTIGLDPMERTQGSETSQYLEEQKTSYRKVEYFPNSGERKGKSPNPWCFTLWGL